MKDKSGCTLAIVSMLLVPFGIIWNGYALSIMWTWFVVPAFHAEPLRIPFAIGLAAIAGYMTFQHVDCEKSSDSPKEKMISGIALMVVRPAAVLLFGWIVQKFI